MIEHVQMILSALFKATSYAYLGPQANGSQAQSLDFRTRLQELAGIPFEYTSPFCDVDPKGMAGEVLHLPLVHMCSMLPRPPLPAIHPLWS